MSASRLGLLMILYHAARTAYLKTPDSVLVLGKDTGPSLDL